MIKSLATRTGGIRAPHVGIVGAGVAGLRCADVLTERGFKVTVLEARDRLGGRVSVIALHFEHV